MCACMLTLGLPPGVFLETGHPPFSEFGSAYERDGVIWNLFCAVSHIDALWSPLNAAIFYIITTSIWDQVTTHMDNPLTHMLHILTAHEIDHTFSHWTYIYFRFFLATTLKLQGRVFLDKSVCVSIFAMIVMKYSLAMFTIDDSANYCKHQKCRWHQSNNEPWNILNEWTNFISACKLVMTILHNIKNENN